MKVEFISGVEITPDRIKLSGQGDLSWLLINGLCGQGQRELERTGVQFEDGELWISDGESQAASLIGSRPDWARRIVTSDRAAGEEEIREALRALSLAGQSLLDKGLPIASRQEAESIVKELERRGAIEAAGPDSMRLRAAEKKSFLLQGKARGGGVLEILVMPESLTLLDLKASNAEPETSDSLGGFEQAIQVKIDPSRPVQAKPVPNRLSVQPLGGIGELREWQAYVGGSSGPAQEEEIERHPISDWLPGGKGAICRERQGTPEQVDGLRCAVQVRICGRLVHSNFAPQPRRLGQLMQPLDLYRPVNPYGQTPAPVTQAG